MKYPIDVSPSGAVLLGTNVSCDGFHRDCKFRVQTHIHDDHMDSFATSKGFQDILMSEPTKELLIAAFNADLNFRENIKAMKLGRRHKLNGGTLILLQSGHILGGVQVAVEIAGNGQRLGYSGDFQWPIDRVIEVDALVVDSTYGSPLSRRKYSQADAEARLGELVASALKTGPVHVLAHRGTLQRGLQVLSGNTNFSILASGRLCDELAVYRRFGYGIGNVVEIESSEGRIALSRKRYIRLYGKGDGFPVELATGTTIVLSAYMAHEYDPITKYSDRSFGVALSNHADFLGTLEYVRATGAKYVVTDNTRSGHAIELANAIKSRLGIKARPSSNKVSYEWGA